MSSVTPPSGPTTGGTAVTIAGTAFINVTNITFGGTAAASFSVVDAATITATTPPGAATAGERRRDHHRGGASTANSLFLRCASHGDQHGSVLRLTAGGNR